MAHATGIRRLLATAGALAVLLGGATAAPGFDCNDVRTRLDAAREQREAFDRRHLRDLQRERKEVKQDLRTEVRGPDQLANRNRELARQTAGWRPDLDTLARRAAEHDASAQRLDSEGKTQAARQQRQKADQTRKKRARIEQQIAEAEAETRANQAEIARIQSDATSAQQLRGRRSELDRELEGLRGQQRELVREVEFFQWVLEMCRGRR